MLEWLPVLTNPCFCPCSVLFFDPVVHLDQALNQSLEELVDVLSRLDRALHYRYLLLDPFDLLVEVEEAFGDDLALFVQVYPLGRDAGVSVEDTDVAEVVLALFAEEFERHVVVDGARELEHFRLEALACSCCLS